MDGSFLNEIANQPDVRLWLEGDGAIDLTPVLASTAHVALVNADGGFVYLASGGGVYEVHSIFRPGAKSAVGAARESLRYMFTATDCVEVVTKVPLANRAAKGLALACGFDKLFLSGGAEYFSLTFARWRARDPEIEAIGHWFHAELEAAKIAAGSPLPIHADDEAHDRAVGASILMARAGNPLKAADTYSAWARLAGYAPINLISLHPPIFDVVDAIVQIHPDALEVLQCR